VGCQAQKSAIAVLERVDREKHHDEDRDDEQGMKVAPAERRRAQADPTLSMRP
jgi:hypothetical protein